jgi:hypothetical protein
MKAKSVKLVQKATMPRTAAAAAPKKADPGAFVIVDNGSGDFQVMGADAAGFPVDISSVATITSVSQDAGKLTANVTGANTFHVAGVAPGSGVIVLVTATWNDGSIGPFSVNQPFDITGGPAVGITVTPLPPVPTP